MHWCFGFGPPTLRPSRNCRYDLVERMEGMLDHQLITGYYPWLASAQNERFASQGGYLVHFADLDDPRILPDTDWRIP